MNGCSSKKYQEDSINNLMANVSLTESKGINSEDHSMKSDDFYHLFDSMSDNQQQAVVEQLLQRMNHHQIGHVENFIKPLLQRDFIVLLPANISSMILENLDAVSLARASAVSRAWRRAVASNMLWRKLIERNVREDSLWRGLSEKRGWKKFLFIATEEATLLIAMTRFTNRFEAERYKAKLKDPIEFQHIYYRDLYPRIKRDIEQIEENWRTGRHRLERINCQSENSKGVYCLQYDDNKIISGLRDNTIKIWNRQTLQCRQTLTGHTGSVLCLQYDERIIASGSSDATVRIWDVDTGAQLNTLIHHSEAVLHLRFNNGMLVTCSKDRSIAVWTMHSPLEIDLRRVLVGHRAAVNVVDFDDTYIVSASGDRTIKVWRTDTCEFIRTLNGHKRGIACLQYRNGIIVSGSSDNTIRIWDIECGTCMRVLEGHEELVRCIRFDNRRIVSGAYDGRIKVWDMKTAMDLRTASSSICIKTLSQHTGRVFRLQFDEFQIVSSSHDDTILIWDFLNTDPDVPNMAIADNQQFDDQQNLPGPMQQEPPQDQEDDAHMENDDVDDHPMPVAGPANDDEDDDVQIFALENGQNIQDVPGGQFQHLLQQIHNGPHNNIPNNAHFQQQQQLRDQIQEQNQQLQLQQHIQDQIMEIGDNNDQPMDAEFNMEIINHQEMMP